MHLPSGVNMNRCSNCGTKRKLTRHHIFPKRFYHGDGPVMILCRYCHDELELKVPFEKQSISFYYGVATAFGWRCK